MVDIVPHHEFRTMPYRRHPDQDAGKPPHHAVIIVGGGMVGLTLALDLHLRGHTPVILQKGQGVSIGSRSICQAKRTLEIWDRLGVGERMRDKGVTWQVGRIFHRDSELYRFDLQPEGGHKMPAFINLQQYFVEEFLLDRLDEEGVGVRWGNAVSSVEQKGDHVIVDIDTPDGPYRVTTDWLIACDGAKSGIRRQMGLEFEGRVFGDKFLISDVKMKADFPTERWFWFEPPFHEGQTVLLHQQADDIWRIDFQLGWDADNEREAEPDRVAARIQTMLGADVDFELDWVSVYVFQCRTLQRYVHDRIVFAGDSAHQVSPFGARGGNGGIQDADNLAWKLAMVLDGRAPRSLLESYNQERVYAARENIMNSSRATDFMTPKTRASRMLRDETLGLAADHAFARPLINSGRLSVPAHLVDSPLNTADQAAFATELAPGSPATDAPLPADGSGAGWLLERLGRGFQLLHMAENGAEPQPPETRASEVAVMTVPAAAEGYETLCRRYDLQPGTTYLFRPDQHIAGRWRGYDPAAIAAAVERASATAG